MRATSVEYSRLVNMGDYQNMKVGVTIQLDEGDSATDALVDAYNEVHGRINAIQADERAERDAQREARMPWRVTPEMVADAPTLWDKAVRAVQIADEHKAEDLVAEAAREARERFGLELPFVARDDGRPVSGSDQLFVAYTGSGNFEIVVPVEGEPRGLKLTYIRSLEDLGRELGVSAE